MSTTTTSDLYETWQDNKDRPAWVQRRRDDLEAATGLDIPRSRSAIDEWLDSYKGTVTKRLKPDGGGGVGGGD